MFDVSFGEFTVSAFVTLLLLGPKQARILLTDFLSFIRSTKIKLQTYLEDLENIKYIIDLEGKPQRTYSLDDISMLQPKIIPAKEGEEDKNVSHS